MEDNNQPNVESSVAILEPTLPKKKPFLPIILGCLVLAGIYWGYGKYSFAQTHEETDDAQVESSINPIVPRTGGYVTHIFVKENDIVKAGDTLFTIDDRDLRIKVQQSEAALMNAQANIKAVQAGVRSAGEGTKSVAANASTAEAGITTSNAAIATAQANIDAAKVRVWKATQDFNRYAALYGQQSATKQQLDAAQAEKESAEAGVTVAMRQFDASKAQLGVTEHQAQAAKSQQLASAAQTDATSQNVGIAEAVVKQRQADLDFSRLQLSYCTVISPANGKISKKNVNVGQLVNPGVNLMNVVAGSDVWVIANFKETQVGVMHEGDKVDLELDAFKGKIFKGTIQSISDATGAKFALLPPDNASGNFVKVVQRIPIKITFDEQPKENVKGGMNVHAIINIRD